MAYLLRMEGLWVLSVPRNVYNNRHSYEQPTSPHFSVCVSVLSSFPCQRSQVSRPKPDGSQHIVPHLDFSLSHRSKRSLTSHFKNRFGSPPYVLVSTLDFQSHGLPLHYPSMSIYLTHISSDTPILCLLIYKNVLCILDKELSSSLGTGKCLLPIINCHLTFRHIPHPRKTLNSVVIIIKCPPTIWNFAINVFFLILGLKGPLLLASWHRFPYSLSLVHLYAILMGIKLNVSLHGMWIYPSVN